MIGSHWFMEFLIAFHDIRTKILNLIKPEFFAVVPFLSHCAIRIALSFRFTRRYHNSDDNSNDQWYQYSCTFPRLQLEFWRRQIKSTCRIYSVDGRISVIHVKWLLKISALKNLSKIRTNIFSRSDHLPMWFLPMKFHRSRHEILLLPFWLFQNVLKINGEVSRRIRYIHTSMICEMICESLHVKYITYAA